MEPLPAVEGPAVEDPVVADRMPDSAVEDATAGHSAGRPVAGDPVVEGAAGEHPAAETRLRDSPRQMFLAGLGVAFVGLAVVGAILPGVPTTVFIIAASYCFAKSCPGLQERFLQRNRLLRPYLALVEPGRPMPTHARVLAIGLMWAFIGASFLAMYGKGSVRTAVAITIAVAGVAGTVAVLRFRRQVRSG